MTDHIDAIRRVSKTARRLYGRDGRSRIMILMMMREFRLLSRGSAAQPAPAIQQEALGHTTAGLVAENKRLSAIVERRVDRCVARSAFPLNRYSDRQVVRLCGRAYGKKMRGEPYEFDCWQEGEKRIWWCEKTSVDRYLQSLGVAPVDYHRVMIAESKSRK